MELEPGDDSQAPSAGSDSLDDNPILRLLSPPGSADNADTLPFDPPAVMDGFEVEVNRENEDTEVGGEQVEELAEEPAEVSGGCEKAEGETALIRVKQELSVEETTARMEFLESPSCV